MICPNDRASTDALKIILSRAATTYRSPSPSSCGEALETVYRCCWGANKILEAYQEYENPVVQSMIESLAELFVYLPDDSAKSAEGIQTILYEMPKELTKSFVVKDVILIGLTSVDTRTLRSALSVCGIKSIFKLRLEDSKHSTTLLPILIADPQYNRNDLYSSSVGSIYRI